MAVERRAVVKTDVASFAAPAADPAAACDWNREASGPVVCAKSLIML